MRFESKQRINGTVDEVERALLDERYPAFLVKNHSTLLEVQAMERKESGDQVQRKVRYRPAPVIDAIGPKKIPPEWFAFVENSTYDRARHELRFQNVPTSSSISKMLINTGTLRLKDAGNGQTERTMDGEISVKLPFLLKPLGMIAERIIQAEGLKILDNEAPVLNRFIAEVLRAG